MNKRYLITLKKSVFSVIFALIISSLFTSCSKNDPVQMSKAEILSSTRWRSTVVRDSIGVDVTVANQGFMGLATYNKNGTYEFFNLDGTPRGDSGYWALTLDEGKRIINSITRNYTRVVDIVELNKNIFTYRVVSNGKTVTVEHVPIQ